MSTARIPETPDPWTSQKSGTNNWTPTGFHLALDERGLAMESALRRTKAWQNSNDLGGCVGGLRQGARLELEELGESVRSRPPRMYMRGRSSVRTSPACVRACVLYILLHPYIYTPRGESDDAEVLGDSAAIAVYRSERAMTEASYTEHTSHVLACIHAA